MATQKPFHFKQFSLAHSRSAQKIGTDSVILGSWLKAEKADTILDIGSGCGVLAFMMAQKFPQAQVLGIELDFASFEESLENHTHSPFKDRVNFMHADFTQWNNKQRFDLIASNPPYFESGQNTNRPARDNARRQKSLSHGILLKQMRQLLTEAGSIYLVLPPIEASNFIDLAKLEGLYLSRFCEVKSKADTPTKRCLFSLSRQASQTQKEELILYLEDGSRHPQHAKLTQDFYL
tara:strand:- start:11983 stop:12687 length:705 start_codon:yes stop_codon:yes gene_type:complete